MNSAWPQYSSILQLAGVFVTNSADAGWRSTPEGFWGVLETCLPGKVHNLLRVGNNRKVKNVSGGFFVMV